LAICLSQVLATMARYFREQDIDEYKECFYLYARSGQIRKIEELTRIMRSLGINPTINELNRYFKEKDGKISFADFLDIMHKHTKVENIPQEIIDAFKAYDPHGKGVISAKDLRHILSGWGERLSSQETDRLFREAKVAPNGNIRYEDFVRFICFPVPDYY